MARPRSAFPAFAQHLDLPVLFGLVLALAGCGTASISFPSAAPDRQTLIGDLFRPGSPGRVPAVVLLHPCGGIESHMYRWALWLRGEGYGAVVVDSFKLRGLSNVCATGSKGPTMPEVAGDAYGALAYLRTLDWVDGTRLAVMGSSYGGAATLYAARRAGIGRYEPAEGGFRAAIAFYPPCEVGGYDTEVPLLMLLAGHDDWTPPAACEVLADTLSKLGRIVRARVYPTANHAFDQPGAVRSYLGHTMSYDGAATSDAENELRRFLAETLK